MKPFAPFLLLASLVLPAAADDCIPPGQSQEVSFERPSLLSPGLPTTAGWAPFEGNPKAYDQDLLRNDPLGPAVPSGGPNPGTFASVTITNQGGSLSGPNGMVQTGFWEGDCLEVFVCWEYRYKATVRRCTGQSTQSRLQVGEGGVGGSMGSGSSSSSCVEYEVWMKGVVCSGVQDVCAC